LLKSTWAQCYKTFYVRNLCEFSVSGRTLQPNLFLWVKPRAYPK